MKTQHIIQLELEVELDREVDGRWIAEVAAVPGALAYGSSLEEALRRACEVAQRTLQDELRQERA